MPHLFGGRVAKARMSLAMLVPLAILACGKDLVDGRFFVCDNPGGSCGEGCTCVAAEPGRNYPGWCSCPTRTACRLSGQCEVGQTCWQGRCQERGCLGTADCETGDTCVAGSLVGKDPAGNFCTAEQCNGSTNPCPEGRDCVDGICLPFTVPDVPEDGTSPADPGQDGADPGVDVTFVPPTVECRPCQADGDCDGGSSCLPLGAGKHCLVSCVEDADCPASTTCYAATTAGKYCIPVTYSCPSCSYDGTCTGTQVCNYQEGACREGMQECGSCAYDFDCRNGMRCLKIAETNTGGCVPACSDTVPCSDSTRFHCAQNAKGVRMCHPNEGIVCGACPANRPFPSEDGQECWECLNDTHCTVDGEHCDPASHECRTGVYDCTTLKCYDGKSCTNDYCDPFLGCTYPIWGGNCLIDGTCYSTGWTNPENGCQVCQPAIDSTRWSMAADGETCVASRCNGVTFLAASKCLGGACGEQEQADCRDGLSCTYDACDSGIGCRYPLISGNCLIGGACYHDGEPDHSNDCRICKSGTTPSAFSDAADGATCTEGTCSAGKWTGFTKCAEGQCNQESVTNDCNDSLSCTTDCDPHEGCVNTVQSGTCLIDGICYTNGQHNPADPCKQCISEKTKSGWSAAPDGEGCPVVSGYTATCNEYRHCEYANPVTTGWKQYDVWVHVPAGTFPMGAPDSEDGSATSERPVHDVTFAKGFLVGKYEVTVLAYEACKAASPTTCTAPDTTDWTGNGWGTNTSAKSRGTHPQNGLTWAQAGAVCSWMGGRLPSEAEFEYAANGSVHRMYPWGDSGEPKCAGNTANFDEDGDGVSPWACDPCATSGCSGTAPAGSKNNGASWSGALDMAGNVREWCQDYWHADYNGAPVNGTAWTSPTASTRVVRGGGFNSPGAEIRSPARASALPTDRNAGTGARCVRTLP